MQKMAKNGTKKGLCGAKSSFYSCGTLEATRTPDLRLRRQLLYPTELRGHVSVIYNNEKISLFQVNYEVYYIRPLQHPLEVFDLIPQ